MGLLFCKKGLSALVQPCNLARVKRVGPYWSTGADIKKGMVYIPSTNSFCNTVKTDPKARADYAASSTSFTVSGLYCGFPTIKDESFEDWQLKPNQDCWQRY